MNKVYKKIWKLAEPYYKKGRPFDIVHINVLLNDAKEVCRKENDIDESLLMPLVILHDIGYGVTGPAYFEKEKKKDHMVVGAKLAREILNEVNYSQDKTDQICHWISVHDNWLYGDNEIYQEDKILGVFNDLEFIWMANPKGFEAITEVLFKGDKAKMLNHIKTDNKLTARPFCCQTTLNLYNKYIKEIEKLINK